jgi:hypothetical protein
MANGTLLKPFVNAGHEENKAEHSPGEKDCPRHAADRL